MLLKKWESLPENMRSDEVRRYYEILKKKKPALFFKRLTDILLSAFLLLILAPLFLILAIAVKCDSRGPVFYRQTRVTRYGRLFRIFKFRSMRQDADRGPKITVGEDPRVTRVGRVIRKFRLDELGQLINILRGDMSFVGTRPEVPDFVARYTPEMMATLLLPAGVTSLASILYKDESSLLPGAEDPARLYREKILPEKMRCNLDALARFGFWRDAGVLLLTFPAVLGMFPRRRFAAEAGRESRR